MAKRVEQRINEDNINDFASDLQQLIDKYDLHDNKKGPITFITSNLNFRADNFRSCPPGCLHIVELCDIHHTNCHLEYRCEC